MRWFNWQIKIHAEIDGRGRHVWHVCAIVLRLRHNRRQKEKEEVIWIVQL